MPPERDMPPTGAVPGRGDGAQETLSPLRWSIARGVLIGGALLLIWAFFAPWLDLSTGFLGAQLVRQVGPWDAVRYGSPLMVLDAPFLGLVACALAIALRGRRRATAALVEILVLCGIACLAEWLVVVTVIPTGLALGYPYYDTRFDLGVWLALAGFIFILAGLVGKARFTGHVGRIEAA